VVFSTTLAAIDENVKKSEGRKNESSAKDENKKGLQQNLLKTFGISGDPKGNRTPVYGVRGRCPNR
jgi:hypothetical protein